MSRLRGIICAIALGCAGLAGCSSFDVTSLVTFKTDSLGRERVMQGSLEAVAESTQSTLTQMGFAANVNRKSETVRISSKTAAGAAFTFVLTRVKNEQGEQTRVRIEWDNARDDNLGLELLAKLETPAPK
jgi:hypothetical protein